MPETLVRVTAPHFCAGLVLREGVCTEAAPILRWCVGKASEELSAQFKGKGWKATQRLRLIPDDVPLTISWRGNEMRWKWRKQEHGISV